MAAEKNISLVIDLDGRSEVFADQNMVDSIIRNLVSNAIKFTKDQGEVIISAHRDKNRMEVTVSDTGVGIAPQDLDKLFNIESKHSTLGTAQEKGTGLGLVLCKEFVEKHKGTIWIESEKGKGSQFKFTLPLSKDKEKL
jgi:signal transduction histidine kinase